MWGNIAFPYQKGNREMEEQRCISAKQFWCCKKRIITKWDISQTFNFTCGNEIACCKIHLPNFLTYLTWGLNKFSPMFVVKLYADTNLDQFTKLKFWCLSVVSFSFRSQEQRLKAHSLGTYRCINKILYLMYLWCILSFQSQQKRLNVHSLGTAMPKFRHLWPSATLATMWTGQCTNPIEANSLTLTSLFSVLLSDVHVFDVWPFTVFSVYPAPPSALELIRDSTFQFLAPQVL